ALLETFLATSREPFMVQEFRPEVTGGDRRVLYIDGEIAGAINRVPQPGETRSNMHVGGRAERSDITELDRQIAAVLGPQLRERGLVLTGIDMIGPYLTEINVTSPTGVRELKRFSDIDAAQLFWDAVEKRHASQFKTS
ncbi:MAG: glutathione synthase, partial [Pseudomonadota bacterium]